MYSKICYILLLLANLSKLNASHIEKDLAKNPLVYYPDREIEYEVADTQFSYQINLSILEEIKSEYQLIHELCNTTTYFKLFYDTLFHDMTWNKISDKNFPTQNLIWWQSSTLERLGVSFHAFNTENNINSGCNHLMAITNHLITLNTEFKDLNKVKSSILNIIPIENLLANSYNYIKETNRTNALDFSHWKADNFFKYTRYSFKISKNNAYITIIIPLFSHKILHKIYRKPISYKNIPYILNSEANYMIEGQIGLNYFSKFEDNCFYANEKFFCHKLQMENECDNQYITKSSKIFQEKCFTKLPFRNMATQIKNDVYFFTIDPFSIKLTCNGSEQKIKLFHHSKILNNKCLINATFFAIDNNSIQDYGIYFAETTIISHENIDTLIEICCIFALFFFCMIIFNISIYYYHKLNAQNNTLYYMETQV